MKYLVDMTKKELGEWMTSLGEKTFRGNQVFRWVQSGIEQMEDMKNIPKGLLGEIKKVFSLHPMKLIKFQQSKEDGTKKYLFQTYDDQYIESVLMKYKYGNTLCISSQIGCNMGCVFCASTLDGKARNITAGEMIDQILLAKKESGENIGHIVVMGMGEPFDNYEQLSRFLTMIHDKEGLGLSFRNITVSTCGMIPMIEKFSEDFPQVNLAISLHKTRDDERSQLMPINKKYGVDKLLKVCKKYAEKTGRRITFEYALIRGENDGKKDREDLIKKLRGIHCHVNLIPLNPVEEIGLKASDYRVARAFAEELIKGGIPATVRREMGRDIDGACGQLRQKEKR